MTLAGITAYGVYVPYNRLDRKRLAEAYGKKSLPGEKAVANYDEDSLTMAVAAALNCVGTDAPPPAAVFFASTTAPNWEKQSAAHIASVMDWEGPMRTADFGGTLRSGTAAMLAGLDLAEKGESALVTAADCRLGAPDGGFEAAFGDGAAAFCFGGGDVLAECVGTHSVAHDFYDTWRAAGQEFVHFFDERFAQSVGYVPFVAEAVQGLLQKTGTKPADIACVVIDAASDRRAAAVLKKAGFTEGQGQPTLIGEFGYAGAASAPMLLAAALETAAAGDLVLLVGYGEGADALLFRVGPNGAKPAFGKGVQYYKQNKDNRLKYEKYLRWKGLASFEPPRRPVQSRSSLPDFYRKRQKNLACYGSRCKKCGTPHFPPSRICVQCKAIDEMEPYRFLGRAAKLATFTFDYVGFSDDPPNVVAVVDFEGGGRMFTNMMDCDLEKVAIDMPVQLVYRRMFEADGINTYFWKCVPAAQREEEAQ